MQIIGGKYRSRRLLAPKGTCTRPTSGRLRGTFFDICQSLVEGSFFLDVFAGAGAMGLEALSRGATRAVFIEKHPKAVACIRKNVEMLGLQEQAEILQGDAFSLLARLEKKKKKFSLIYADPPYSTRCHWKGQVLLYSERVLRLVEEHQLLLEGGSVFIEESSKEQLEQTGLHKLQIHKPRMQGVSTLHHFKCLEENNTNSGIGINAKGLKKE